MKKIVTLFFIAGNIIAANAQDIAAGFYHVKNATTGRCMIVTDNSKGATDTKTFSTIDLGSVETNRNAEFVGTHPGSICYVTPLSSGKYDVAAQGTSISKFTGGQVYPVLTKQADGTYTIKGSYGNVSIMLGDKSEKDRITDEYKDEGRLVEVSTLERGTWELLPIGTSTTGEFIGIKPEIQTADGTWWTTFYAGFAFDLYSTGMKAFYVDTANDTEFSLKEITGTIPVNTPVLIQCATNDYTQNIIKPKTSYDVPIKVLMDGVYFDCTAANHFNAKAYDKNTMRVLGVDENNKLVFHVAPTSYLTEGEYLPHNKAYLVVTSSAAETLYVKHPTTFTSKTAEGIDMVFSILDDKAKTCQVGYLNGSVNKLAVDKNVVNGLVTIPETVEGYTVVKIGKYAFYNVNQMTSVAIPNTVTAIDEFAFSGCNGLTTFELPANVTSLGERALSSLRNATSIKVAEGNPKYDSRDNCNAIIETATNKLLFGYMITTIPATVKEIGERAFNHNIIIDYTLTIPSTITKIGDYAFESSMNLTLQVEHTTPLQISENVFQGLTNCTLRVPTGCKTAYGSATGWKNFGTIYEGNEGTTFTAKTVEGIDMVFTILDESAKTCQVGYLDGSYGKMAVDRDDVNGAVTIPETVEGYTVVKIGRYALYYVYQMTSVTIPNTVTAIDDYAFSGCNGLTTFELPASVTSLGNHALTGFSSVTSIKVAEDNKKFDSRDNCNAINETATNKLLFGYIITTIPATVTEIGEWAFSDIGNYFLTIPSTITKIDDFAFSSCSKLTLEIGHTTPLQISENVFQGLSNSILRVPTGYKAAYEVATGWSKFDNIFEGNEGATFTAKTAQGIYMVFTILDETAKTCQIGYLDGSYNKIAVDKNAVNGQVTIPETVKGYTIVKIGKSAFFNVNQMTSVTIPNTVTAIDEYAFSGCIGLTSFELPASVISIGRSALSNLRNATSIKVAEGNPKYDSRDNCNAIIEMATNKLLFGNKTTTIPATVTEIGEYAFYFIISDYTLTIPSTITKIGDYAFSYCKYLTLEVEHTTPLAINDNVFEGLSNSTLRVPAGRKAAYASANGWKIFGEENIVEMAAPDPDPTIEETDVTNMTDVIYIEPQTATIGTQFVLPVKLRNTTDAAGYEFLLTLPEGIEVAKDDSDDFIFSRTGRHKASHSIQISAYGTNNVYKIIYYTMDNYVKAGDGVVINVTLNVGSELKADKYAIKISNALYSMPAAASVDLESVTTSITLTDLQKGDANGDGSINVTDVVAIVNNILGRPNTNFHSIVADVNGDGLINVTDVVAVINIILGRPNAAGSRFLNQVFTSSTERR